MKKFKLIPTFLLLLIGMLSITGHALGQQTTLDIFAVMPDDAKDAINAAYKKIRPDVTLMWSYSGGGYWDQFLVRYLGGVAPDVVQMRDLASELVSQGAFLPLDSLVEKEGIEIAHWAQGTGYLTDGGVRYFLPWLGWTGITIFNGTLFDEAGVAKPDPTWTQDDLLEKARRLTRYNPEGEFEQIGIHLLPMLMSPGGVGDYIIQNGGQIFNEERQEIFPDFEAAVDAVEFLASLTHEYRVLNPRFGNWGGRDAFSENRVAMLTDVNSALSVMPKEQPFEWNITSMPKGVGPARAGFHVGGAGISAQSAHKDEAWEFIKWLTSDEGQMILAPTFRGLPVNVSLITSPEFLYEMSHLDWASIVQQVSLESVPQSPLPKSGQVSTIVDGLLRRAIFQGDLSPSAAIESARSQANPILAR